MGKTQLFFTADGCSTELVGCALQGQIHWYDYVNKNGRAADQEGTVYVPRFSAWKLPNGEARFIPQYLYYHADGNGNVTALINALQLAVAEYTYDPYGKMIAQSGPISEVNHYRFSSKETHTASGILHFLYRYCDPSLQRWINCDRLGEAGNGVGS